MLGRKIKLDVACVCGSCLTVLHAGKGPHAALLRCIGCDRARQWISHPDYRALSAIVTEIAGRVGEPSEITYRSIKQRSHAMAEYDNTNSGALFKNNEKETDKHPDYRGQLNVDGTDFWISGWLKTSKKGLKFLSLAVKPKDESKGKPKPDFDDEIGF